MTEHRDSEVCSARIESAWISGIQLLVFVGIGLPVHGACSAVLQDAWVDIPISQIEGTLDEIIDVQHEQQGWLQSWKGTFQLRIALVLQEGASAAKLHSTSYDGEFLYQRSPDAGLVRVTTLAGDAQLKAGIIGHVRFWDEGRVLGQTLREQWGRRVGDPEVRGWNGPDFPVFLSLDRDTLEGDSVYGCVPVPTRFFSSERRTCAEQIEWHAEHYQELISQVEAGDPLGLGREASIRYLTNSQGDLQIASENPGSSVVSTYRAKMGFLLTDQKKVIKSIERTEVVRIVHGQYRDVWVPVEFSEIRRDRDGTIILEHTASIHTESVNRSEIGEGISLDAVGVVHGARLTSADHTHIASIMDYGEWIPTAEFERRYAETGWPGPPRRSFGVTEIVVLILLLGVSAGGIWFWRKSRSAAP